jgi:hypothetical protein
MNRRAVAASAAFLVLAAAATAIAGGKNLQHYPKDISMEDLKAEMKVLKNSLGVDCAHCHQMQPRDFSKDVDNKKVARSMLDMQDKLNQACFTKDFLKEFKGKQIKSATCFMCHKGKEKPVYEPSTDADKEKAKKFETDAKDAKHKDLSAGMKRLTDKVSKDYFNWKGAPKATCWMCHRGSLEIETKAPGDD